MQFFYCENCKDELQKPQTYQDIVPGDYPALKVSLEASSASASESLQKWLQILRSPKYKGEACSRCEKSFADDEPRWIRHQHQINFEDISRRIIAKFSWMKAETLGDYKQRAQKLLAEGKQ